MPLFTTTTTATNKQTAKKNRSRLACQGLGALIFSQQQRQPQKAILGHNKQTNKDNNNNNKTLDIILPSKTTLNPNKQQD